MSFILDALKKSEAERQRQAGPALLEMRVVAPQRRLPLWAIALGILLAINVLVLGWFALRPGTPGTAPTAAPAASATAALRAGGRLAAPAAVAPPDALPPATGAGALGSGAEGTAAARVSASPDRAAAEADVSDADLEPAVASAAPGAASTQAAGGAHEEPANHGLQNYAELAGRIPQLRLDLHVYSANPAERYAFINMHRLREGDTTPEGVQVKQITRDGVVLDYRGTGFFLGHD